MAARPLPGTRSERALSGRRAWRNLARGLRRALELLARPVRAARGRGAFVLQPYRGYGSRDEAFLIGRVFKQPTFGSGPGGGVLRHQMIDVLRGFLRRGVADAALIARFCGAEQGLTTDRDGYFRVHLRPAEPPAADRLWHPIELELLSPTRFRAAGEVFVPPAACRYVVISDIDDTVMYTGVAQKLKMLWRLFMQGAQSRVAFPGMATLLRALHGGRSGGEFNPMLYVSRGPWSIYEVLDEFFNLHRIPIGPLLFLREWGVTLQRPLPRRAEDHKLELIRNMLALYHDLPFVLIGDSGQHDPEIYAQTVREHPGRVVAIYIRDVSRKAERRRAIEELATQVVEAGSSLLLAADSLAMAEHAVEHGLIPSAALAAVRAEIRQDEGETAPTLEVEEPTAGATRRAVQRGQLRAALEEESAEGSPANVVVERDRTPR